MQSTIRPIDQFMKTLKAARRVSTPLLSIRSADPALAIARVQEAVGKSAPMVHWDIIRGLVPMNENGTKELGKLVGERDPTGIGPVEALVLASQLSEDSVLLYANAQRFWVDPQVTQGIWNLRDAFKSSGRTLVLLTTPGAVLPDELTQDVLVLDEPLPGIDDLARIFQETVAAADVPDTAEVAEKAMDAMLGLAAFPAEQVLAMSVSKGALDLEQLWDRKRQVIEQTPGLSVWRGGETFDDIGGCENIKRFLRAVINGAEAPRGIVFLDEIEKAFAGTGTDLSGVKTELTGAILSWMQDRSADGCLLIGPPGAAKSLVAKATGNTAGIPTIAFDLGAMQNALVGSSGERLRSALKVVDAVTNGRSLWIATCNSFGTLPPELRRRFTLGTFFFDLPSPEERATIWTIYLAKYGITGELPDHDGWTGAEIKECCRKAYRLKLSLKESAEYIVPVSRSAADQIKALRQQASGKFISASSPGVYQFQETPAVARTGRAFRNAEA
ncbi:MAG TPA: AAA family ATPase [Bryobacteraceae bacterium]|nr:AAA family ATPase [Bryobacteraceae bacterium]